MSAAAKKIIQDFYMPDIMLDPGAMDTFLHPDVVLDWNSSKGFLQLKKQDILDLSAELHRAYVRSKIRISHILSEGDSVTVRYSHYVKTIENPREDILLAHFFVIWEVKDGQLFRGFQMSQLS